MTNTYFLILVIFKINNIHYYLVVGIQIKKEIIHCFTFVYLHYFVVAEEDHCHSPYRDLYSDNRRGSDLYGISMPPPMLNRGSENGSLHSVDSRFVTARAYSQPVSPSTQASTSTLNLQSRHGYTNEYGIQEILESE